MAALVLSALGSIANGSIPRPGSSLRRPCSCRPVTPASNSSRRRTTTFFFPAAGRWVARADFPIAFPDPSLAHPVSAPPGPGATLSAAPSPPTPLAHVVSASRQASSPQTMAVQPACLKRVAPALLRYCEPVVPLGIPCTTLVQPLSIPCTSLLLAWGFRPHYSISTEPRPASDTTPCYLFRNILLSGHPALLQTDGRDAEGSHACPVAADARFGCGVSRGPMGRH
jgi:hypothetical protein